MGSVAIPISGGRLTYTRPVNLDNDDGRLPDSWFEFRPIELSTRGHTTLTQTRVDVGGSTRHDFRTT